jgi:hypothetical protein
MQADVDMSGRIEETNRPTALALANGVTVCVWISGRDKWAVIEALQKDKPERERKFIHVRVFSTLLFLLLKDHIRKLSQVRIDLEYVGHEPDIKDWVMTLCRRAGIAVHRDQITFGQIGKKSPAHTVAYEAFKGISRPGKIVTAEELLGILKK